MEARCHDIKRQIKFIQKSEQFGNDIVLRLKSLCEQLIRVQDGLVSSQWIDSIFNDFDLLINTLFTRNDYLILAKILQVENSIMFYLIAHLRIPATVQNTILTKTRGKYTDQSIDNILPKFLSLLIQSTFENATISKAKNKVAFVDFWEAKIPPYFEAFQIPQNNFAKCIAKKILCNDVIKADRKLLFNIKRIKNFMKLFFGNIINYKFYSKISKIYSRVFENMSQDKWNQKIEIIPTSIRLAYTGIQTIETGKKTQIDALGIMSENFRGDGLIIFGRHSHSDIVFPADESAVDLVSLILFNSNDSWYGIDCSTVKGFYCGIKIPLSIPINLSVNELFSLAKSQLFKVDNISYENVIRNIEEIGDNTYRYSQDDYINYSSITISCIEGCYPNNRFIFSTKTRNPKITKNEHVFGSGGNGIGPDLYIPREIGPLSIKTGISKEHMKLIYTDCWSYYDGGSLNGTFLLMKDSDEYNHQLNSTCKNIFFDGINGTTILVSGYTFYLHPI